MALSFDGYLALDPHIIHRMQYALVACAVAGLLLSSGCQTPTPVERAFDEGHVEGHQYRNDFFHFSMELPEEWVLQNKAQTTALMDQGAEHLAKDERQQKQLKKAAEVGTAYLVTLFRYEMGTPVPFNPSFMVLAENVNALPGVKKGSDYLFHARKMLESTALDYSYEGPLPGEMVGGIGFEGMGMVLHSNGTEIYQDYYSTIKDGFALSIVMTYPDSATADTLRDILAGIRFTGERTE
jgi:hypothetical protein